VDPLMPEIALFACQQHNPEVFWKPEYQVHDNGATGIAGVTLVSEHPTQHRAFFSALVDDASIVEKTDALCVETGRGVIRIQSPQQFAAHFPAPRLSGEPRGAILMAATVEVADLDRAAQHLEDNGVAFARHDTALHVANDHCCGLVLELAQTGA